MVWSFGDEQAKLAALKLFEYFWNYNNREEESSEEEDQSADDEDEDDEEKAQKKASTEIMCEAIDAWLFLVT